MSIAKNAKLMSKNARLDTATIPIACTLDAIYSLYSHALITAPYTWITEEVTYNQDRDRNERDIFGRRLGFLGNACLVGSSILNFELLIVI